MSDLWGTLDVDEIPDDPYFVDTGSYTGSVTRAETTVTRADKPKIVIEYTIDDDDPTDYAGLTVSEWFDHFPDLHQSELSTMDSQERSRIVKTMSRVKARIRHLGYEPTTDFDLKDLIDTPVEFAVEVNENENPDTGEIRKFSNVRYVKALED